MSFPIRIVEALHMGKPLVVSRMCGMEDLVDGCGLAVEPRDAGALAEAMLRLIKDTQLREDMIRRCATLAKEYDRCASVQKLVRVLRMAVDGV
jgi:glycosyltransferase involved in cell wall biosynthesis